ncbi:hypothetical protein [Emticicia sp. SJ17W-69]|uniref:hypothetical protein n=1 Tax=Emticicia sp. SJ17W-69 TaxID=3421657 RepID=UPI003EBE8249
MNIKIKRFLFKISLLFLLTWGIIEVLYDFNPYQKYDLENSYTAAIIDKYARLQSLKSPKIVMIAGSNFAYGINSKMIEDSLQHPVVNMSMHYDYGTDFMLQQIAPELHKGDTVIMGFEYIISSEGNFKEKILMANFFPKAKEWFSYRIDDEKLKENSLFLETFPQAISVVSAVNTLIKYIGENAQVRVSSFRLTLERLFKHKSNEASIDDIDNIFFRKAINQYGDLISHFNNPIINPIPRAIINDKVSFKKPIADMNDFYEKMQKMGVKVCYVYPSYAASSYQFDKEIINKLQGELENKAHFPILGKPEDFVYPDSLCQDMTYHLNVKGRDVRTQNLIRFLKKL